MSSWAGSLATELWALTQGSDAHILAKSKGRIYNHSLPLFPGICPSYQGAHQWRSSVAPEESHFCFCPIFPSSSPHLVTYWCLPHTRPHWKRVGPAVHMAVRRDGDREGNTRFPGSPSVAPPAAGVGVLPSSSLGLKFGGVEPGFRDMVLPFQLGR